MREALSPTRNEVLAETKLQGGLDLLRKYAPFVTPRQPTVVLLKPIKGDSVATYDGPIRDRHYISLDQKYELNKRTKDDLTMCHELVHQWHAELMGPVLWWTIDPDANISDEEFETQPIELLIKKLWGILGSDIPALTDALTEGLATLVELKIFEQLFKDYAHGDYQLGRDLRALKKGPLYNPNWEDNSPHHALGFRAVSQIYDKSGLPGVLDFIKRVDYEKCNRIVDGTKKYFRMLAKPERIPLL